jgi:3-hydroxyisobutyrate dehydrogenase-like beta-hydroxyacid dehydrogenase
MTTIGFIGLGAMGSRIAGRLLDAGHDVYGTNRTRQKPELLLERGLQWRDTPREVAAAADVVFSMVTDDDALDAITLGPDGILAGLAEGKVYIDMGSRGQHARNHADAPPVVVSRSYASLCCGGSRRSTGFASRTR